MAAAQATALITGASAGIGRELARVFAANGHPLALTARRKDRLDALAREIGTAYGVPVSVFAHDLEDPGAPVALHRAVTQAGIEVGILVNNAGFGTQGAFATSDRAREEALIAVNVLAPVKLAQLFLPAMLKRGSGRILNVASTAAFQPGPSMANYYASKAYWPAAGSVDTSLS